MWLIKMCTPFFSRYRHLVTDWTLFDNSGPRPEAVAVGNRTGLHIIKAATWQRLQELYGNKA